MKTEDIREDAKSSPTLLVMLDQRGFVSAQINGLRVGLHDGDQIEAVMRVMIDRLTDPNAPKEEK